MVRLDTGCTSVLILDLVREGIELGLSQASDWNKFGFLVKFEFRVGTPIDLMHVDKQEFMNERGLTMDSKSWNAQDRAVHSDEFGMEVPVLIT